MFVSELVHELLLPLLRSPAHWAAGEATALRALDRAVDTLTQQRDPATVAHIVHRGCAVSTHELQVRAAQRSAAQRGEAARRGRGAARPRRGMSAA